MNIYIFISLICILVEKIDFRFKWKRLVRWLIFQHHELIACPMKWTYAIWMWICARRASDSHSSISTIDTPSTINRVGVCRLICTYLVLIVSCLIESHMTFRHVTCFDSSMPISDWWLVWARTLNHSKRSKPHSMLQSTQRHNLFNFIWKIYSRRNI